MGVVLGTVCSRLACRNTERVDLPESDPIDALLAPQPRNVLQFLEELKKPRGSASRHLLTLLTVFTILLDTTQFIECVKHFLTAYRVQKTLLGTT
jgi:hypothetical protein